MSVLDEDTRRVGRLLHYTGLLVAVVCGTIGYTLAYAPLTQSIETTSALIDELKQSVQNGPVIRREHERASKYLQSITKRLEALHQRVPPDAEAGEFLKQVTQIASEEQVALSNFQPDRTADKDGYAEMEVTLTGKGGFASICSFFDRLGRLPRLSKVKHLNISANNAADGYPMKATLAIYFGLRGADAAPPKGVRRG